MGTTTTSLYRVIDSLTGATFEIESVSARGAKSKVVKAHAGYYQFRYLTAYEVAPVVADVPVRPAPLRTEAELMAATGSPVADWEIDYSPEGEYFVIMERCGDDTDGWTLYLTTESTLSGVISAMRDIYAGTGFIRLEVIHYLPIPVDPMQDELFSPPAVAPIDANGWTYTELTLAPVDMTCGTCGGVWNSTEVPTPAGRCPFEYDHDSEDQESIGTGWIAAEAESVLILSGEPFAFQPVDSQAAAARARILDALTRETDIDAVDKLCREFAYWADQD